MFVHLGLFQQERDLQGDVCKHRVCCDFRAIQQMRGEDNLPCEHVNECRHHVRDLRSHRVYDRRHRFWEGREKGEGEGGFVTTGSLFRFYEYEYYCNIKRGHAYTREVLSLSSFRSLVLSFSLMNRSDVAVLRARQTQKRHYVAIAANLVEGFRKMRIAERREFEEEMAKERAEAKAKLEKMMVMGGILDKSEVDMDAVGKKQGAKKKDFAKGTIFQKKKLGLVHGRGIFAATGSDAIRLKHLDESYGATLMLKTKSVSPSSPSSTESPEEDMIVSPSPSPSQPLCQAHTRYARAVEARVDNIRDVLYQRKRKRVEDEKKAERAAEWMKDSLRLVGGRDNVTIAQRRSDQKKEAARLRRENVDKIKMDTNGAMSAAEQGEKNLLDFMQRFHGGFFYQKNQLFFEGFQLMFINALTATLAPNIVGPAWSVVGPRLCKQFGWTDDDFHEVLVSQAPRRFGKTIAIAAAVINYALAKSSSEIAIFSTCKRVSGFLRDKIKEILIQSGYQDWIVGMGGEHIFLKDPNDPNDQIRKIFSYPASTVISIFSFFVCVCVSGEQVHRFRFPQKTGSVS